MDEPSTAPPAAPAHAFRTYASDLAKLSGKGGATAVQPTPAPKEPEPVPLKPKPAAAHPAAGQPVASAPTPPAPTPRPVAPSPEPLAPETPKAPPRPYDPPPATIIPKAPSTSESREDILARLKARAMPTPVQPPPTPAEPPPADIFPKAPSTNEKREEVLARLRGKSGAPSVTSIAPIRPAPSTPPAPTSTPVDPSPIHTYKSDFSDKTKRENASPITVLAAEQNTPQPAPQPLKENSQNRIFLVVGSLLLILAGGASVFFAYTFVTGRPMIPFAPLVPSLIFGDRHEEISGSGIELRGALTGLGANVRDGEVTIAYVTTASTTAKGATIMIPAEGGALIEALDLPAPAIVLRNIENESTVGVINEGGETRPFFILRVASYERTFAGMLSWEPTMARDLGAFYPAYPTESVGTSSASSTPRQTRPVFRDEVLDNHDVRVLRDTEGRAVIIYGYRDKETLIITRNEASFSELLSRLAATRAQ